MSWIAWQALWTNELFLNSHTEKVRWIWIGFEAKWDDRPHLTVLPICERPNYMRCIFIFYSFKVRICIDYAVNRVSIVILYTLILNLGKL